jgi:integrase
MSVTENARGKHEVYYRVGGKQRKETYTRKLDATKRDTEIKLAIERGEPIPKRGRGDAKETFEKFAREGWWPAEVAGKKLSLKTQERYAEWLDKHLIPRIGDEPLTHIDVPTCLAVRSGLAKDKVPDYTAARTLKLLRQILHHAVLSGKLTQNPADIFSRPKMLPPQKRKGDVVPIWPDDTERMRAAILASKSPYALRDATLISVLAYAGLRPIEAHRLTWGCVQAKQLRVVESTKTGKSRNVPKLIKPLRDDLAAWKKACADTSDSALVFPGDGGKEFTKTARGNWRGRVFQPHAPTGTAPYSFRHGYSLLLAREGVDDGDAARRMGHSKTMHSTHYDGFIEALREESRQTMEAVVKAARTAAAKPKAQAA